MASVTVSNISSETTFTATYSNVSDTCTVTVSQFIFYDDASVDNSSTLFGNSYALRSGSNTTGWNSNGYYTVKTQSSGTKESVRIIAPLTGVADDFILEWDAYCEGSDGSSGLVIYNSSTAWEKLSDNCNSMKEVWYGYNNGSYHETKYYSTIVDNGQWTHYKFTMQGNQFSILITLNGETVWEHTETIHFTRSSSTQYGFNSEWQANRVMRYKNIVAYKI